MNKFAVRLPLFLLLVSACSGEITTAGYVDNGMIPTFSEFEEATYKEPREEGVYVVNGDTPVANEKQLREYYDSLYTQSLIVDRSGNSDNVWSNSQKRNLRYCVSNEFGSRKQEIVAALEQASANGWEQAADVDFVYVPSQDSNCTPFNNNVVFDVRPTTNAPYLARAFFPGQNRQSRNLIVDQSAFFSGWPLDSVLAHELGHTLGFRHEHTRPEAGACYEDNRWRPLSPYDAASIMHYPQCNGASNFLSFSQNDYNGAALLYGPAGGEPTTPDEPGNTGTAENANVSGSVSQGQTLQYQAIEVLGGTTIQVAMTGSNDADLYVRFSDSPTLSAYDCRPYTSGSNETCSLDVPSNVSSAYIMVHGYTAANYALNVSWVSP